MSDPVKYPEKRVIIYTYNKYRIPKNIPYFQCNPHRKVTFLPDLGQILGRSRPETPKMVSFHQRITEK